MNFCSDDFTKKNCLWLLHFIAIGLFNVKVARVLLAYAILLQFAVAAVETVMFSIHPEYFMQYAPFLFSRAYGTAAAMAILWKRRFMENFWEGLDMWASSASFGHDFHAKVTKKIVQESNVLAVFIFSVILFLSAIMMRPGLADFDYCLILHLLREWYPKFTPGLVVVFKLSFQPIFYAMLVHPLLVFYAAQHIRIQGSMFYKKLETITSDFDGAIEEELNSNDNFQEEIQRRLSYVIARHIQFIRFQQKVVSELVKPLFVIFTGMGFILGLSVVLLAYEHSLGVYRNSWSHTLILAGFILLAAVLWFCLFSSGQAVENVSEKLLTSVMNIKWYTFKRSNQMIMMVFMLNSLKLLRLYFSTTLAVNYRFGLKMAKGMYSVVSLLLTMHLKSTNGGRG